MKLLLPIVLVADIFGLALACTQHSIGYVSTAPACEDEGNSYRNYCKDVAYKYAQYNVQNMERLGAEMSQEVSCDTCQTTDRHCYCVIKFWRLKEWIGNGLIPNMTTAELELDPKEVQKRIWPFKTVDC
ncbi:hypothetical protein J1614_004297 [Plenodomus biglobosus]|nr:hypothetical protein J1614_004297 [Plenodomus biglobosus]